MTSMVSGKGVAVRVVGLEFALLVARNVIVLLADVIDPVVMERLAGGVLEPAARQHHHGAAHAGRDVPGGHRPPPGMQ